MKKFSTKWLEEIENNVNWRASESFICFLNYQLPREFESLLGKSFDREMFYFILYGNLPMYFPNSDIPFGSLTGTLMLSGSSSIDLGFKWFDQYSKLLLKSDEDISHTNIEFHWIDLPLDSIEISRLRKYELIDIRLQNGLDAPFPIMSYSKNIGSDVNFNFKLENAASIPETLIALSVAQKEWNRMSLINGIYVQGIFHSARFSHENEKGQAVFPIDTGSAFGEVFNFIIAKLVEAKISIKELEISND